MQEKTSIDFDFPLLLHCSERAMEEKEDDRKHCQRHQKQVTELLDSHQYFYSSWQKWGEQSDHFSFALRWLQVEGVCLTDWLKHGKKLYVPDNSL